MKKDHLADKKGLIEAFHDNRLALLEVAHSWPVERVREVFLGDWSLLDLLAHLSGWDDANRLAVAAIQARKLPEFYAHKDPDWQTYNAGLIQKYRKPGLVPQINEVERTLNALEDCLLKVDARDFFRDYGARYKGWKVTIARLIESELHDEAIHISQMLAWLKKA